MHKRPDLGKNSRKGGQPLQTINKSPPEILARQTWLHYYNDYLRSVQKDFFQKRNGVKCAN